MYILFKLNGIFISKLFSITPLFSLHLFDALSAKIEVGNPCKRRYYLFKFLYEFFFSFFLGGRGSGSSFGFSSTYIDVMFKREGRT